MQLFKEWYTLESTVLHVYILAFAIFYAFSSTQHPLAKIAKKTHLTANAKRFFEGLGSHRQDHELLAFVIFPTNQLGKQRKAKTETRVQTFLLS